MEWILSGLIFSGGSFFHGITGFGFVILTLPFLIIFHDPHEAVIICIALGVANTIYLAIQTWKDIIFGMVKRLFLFGLFGLPFGAYFFVNFDVKALKISISALVVLFGLLLLSKWTHRFKRTSLTESCIGFLSGFFQMSVGLTGIPPAVYLTLQDYKKLNFRASINAFLLILPPVGLVFFWFLIGADKGAFVRGIAYVPAVVIGQYLGVKLSRRFSQVLFKRIVTLTILGTGIYNLAYTLFK